MAYGDFEQFYYGGEIKLLAQSRAKCLALSAFFFFLNSFWVRVASESARNPLCFGFISSRLVILHSSTLFFRVFPPFDGLIFFVT